MKIIDLTEFYAPQGGGVKTYINNKIKAAQEFGHELIIIAPGRENRIETKHGSKIYWVKGPRELFDERYGVFRSSKAIHAILDRENPDIVEGSSPWAGGKIVSQWPGRAKKVWVFHLLGNRRY